MADDPCLFLLPHVGPGVPLCLFLSLIVTLIDEHVTVLDTRRRA